jgi:hypothetical protein
MEAGIDRLVLEHRACETQQDLDRFWNRVPEHMHETVIERLLELFPPDPNECMLDPYRLRTSGLSRGMEEWMATMVARTSAHHCVYSQGRTEQCERCESYLEDFPDLDAEAA